LNGLAVKEYSIFLNGLAIKYIVFMQSDILV
jgi:hypothetical protein